MTVSDSQPNEGNDRRSFLRKASLATLAAGGLGLMSRDSHAQTGSTPTADDIAVLQFLAAAEILEDDLWQQYTELAQGNSGFAAELQAIDPSLIRYIQDDRDDERSHAALINEYLRRIDPALVVDLTPFKTIPGSTATGSQGGGRLTDLRTLTVDTSWYFRYRDSNQPDFPGFTPRQVVNLTNVPTIPVNNSVTVDQMRAIARAAAFHFCAIEQGGSSLYVSLLPQVTNLDVLRILAAIGPTEVYHFATFHKSLETMTPGTFNGITFPALEDPQGTFPEPTTFLDPTFPKCSVIRPTKRATSGPLAAATGLVASGLFAGQTNPAFASAVVALATAADNAVRAQNFSSVQFWGIYE